jgi:sucrose-6F-phosphate phosphohydrolase
LHPVSDCTPTVRLFATDIDETIFGDPKRDLIFSRTWESLHAEDRPLLVYNTGRSVGDVKWLMLDGRIPNAEFIIGGIGTEVFDPVDAHVSAEYAAHIAYGWDWNAVKMIVEPSLGARLQTEEFLNPYKLSWNWHRATPGEIARLQLRLTGAGLDVCVLYTNNVFLDVIPSRAGKANALAWLCHRIGIELDSVVVAGAGGNNSTMFQLPGVRGILVGNASRELFAAAGPFRPFVACESGGGGVIAGLKHFEVLATTGAADPISAP